MSSKIMDLIPTVEQRAADRRATSHELLELVREIHANQIESDKRLMAHMQDEPIKMAEEIARLMAKAFPAGDPDGHRRHHELVIRQAEAKTEFWSKMVFELTRWGLIGLAAWLVHAAYKHFLAGSN